MTDSVRAYGGVAGEAAVTEDLERGARIIYGAAELIAQAGAQLREVEGYVATARAHGSEPTRRAAGAVAGDLWEATASSGGTSAVARNADDLADRLRQVAEGFLEAEHAAMSHVSALTRGRLAVTSMWGTGLWVARHTWAAVLTATPLTVAGPGRKLQSAIRPDGMPSTTGYLNKDTVQLLVSSMDRSVLGFDAQAYALAAALATLEGLFGEGHASSVAQRTESYPARSPRGLADLMDGILAEQNRMDGAVSIETVEHADGTRSHIVSIPGTEDWTPWNDNPHDAQSNLTGVVGASSDAQMAIVDAMRAAGIKQDDDVMLAGHSQGGINAVALASRAEFLEEFNVTHVVTAGSPTGRMDLPDSVNALHLEHTEDLVAGLDAVPNPPTPQRTTVERDLSLSGDTFIKALGATVGGAHHLAGYRSTANVIDAGKAGTSASAWKQSAGPFLSGERSVLKEYVPVVQKQVAQKPVNQQPVVQKSGPDAKTTPGPRPE